MDLQSADGGWGSRKFWLAVGIAGGIALGAIGAGLWPLFSAQYQAYIGGLLGVLGIYCGANIGSQYTVSKNLASAAPPGKPAPGKTLPKSMPAAPPEDEYEVC